MPRKKGNTNNSSNGRKEKDIKTMFQNIGRMGNLLVFYFLLKNTKRRILKGVKKRLKVTNVINRR